MEDMFDFIFNGSKDGV